MDLMPLSVLLLQAIPESICLTFAGLAISGAKFRWDQVFKIGLLQAVTAFIVRRLPLQFGVHSILLVLSLSLYISWLLKMSITASIKASLVGFVLLAFSEALVTAQAMKLVGTSYGKDLLTLQSLRIVFGLVAPFTILVIGALKMAFCRMRQGKRINA